MEIPYVVVANCPTLLPSPHDAPPPLRPLPGVTPPATTNDNRELWAQTAHRFNHTVGDALNSHRASFEAYLDDAEPPIYCAFGSVRAPQDLSAVMIKTARALGRRAVVSRGWADISLVDNEPECCHRRSQSPALFARVAAVVHHGGAGTTFAAARAGAPQVVVPQMYDQHYWARRVHDLGIGTAHASGAPMTATLRSHWNGRFNPVFVPPQNPLLTSCAAMEHGRRPRD